jgi:hypothetical protein
LETVVAASSVYSQNTNNIKETDFNVPYKIVFHLWTSLKTDDKFSAVHYGTLCLARSRHTTHREVGMPEMTMAEQIMAPTLQSSNHDTGRRFFLLRNRPARPTSLYSVGNGVLSQE